MMEYEGNRWICRIKKVKKENLNVGIAQVQKAGSREELTAILVTGDG